MSQSTEEDVHDVLGVAHRILVDSEASNGQAAVVEVTMPQGAGAPPHANRNEHLVWCVVDGSIEFETEGGRRRVDAGRAAFIERGSRHALTNSAARPARAIMLALPGGVEGFFREAAAVLTPGAPAGPPPPAAVEAFADVARRYGIELDVGRAA